MKKAFYRSMILSAVFILVLTACGAQGQLPTTPETVATETNDSSVAVIAEGHLVPARDVTLIFQDVGTVVEVSVQVGTKSRKVTFSPVLAAHQMRPPPLPSSNWSMHNRHWTTCSIPQICNWPRL